MPLLTAEEEVVLAKDIELGPHPHGALGGHPRPARVDAPRHRAQDPDQAAQVQAAPRPRGAPHRAAALEDESAGEFLVTAPVRPRGDRRARTRTGGAPRAGEEPAGDLQRAAGRGRLHRTPRLARTWRSPPPGAPRARRRRADARWARDMVALPAIQRWIEAGHDAELFDAWGTDPRPDDEVEAISSSARQGRSGPPDLGEPPARRLRREEVRQSRHGPAGPHPGGQRRPDAGGRQVRVRSEASNSRRTRPGGSARRSSAASPTSRGPSASRSTWWRP